MKYFCMALLLCNCLCINSNAQIDESKIPAYSKFLSMRNARLIECDSIAPYLEPVYASFIKTLVQYRRGIRNRISTRQLQSSYRHTQRNIYKLLDKKRRKMYKRLVKSTGNIFLVERIKNNAELFRMSATHIRLPV